MQVKPIPALSLLCAALLVLAACNKPAVPDPERPPEPQAGQRAASWVIHEPLDKAKAVEESSRQAAEAQRAAIEAAGG